MNKALLVFTFFSSTMLSGCVLNISDRSSQSEVSAAPTSLPHSPTQIAQSSPLPSATKLDTAADFTATFEVSTLGTKRIFTDAMYHNQSPDVFIEKERPSIVQVRKNGTTWNDFFSTLPFTLTETCLITGTKQTFCSSEKGTLRFFLNDQEVADALDMPIYTGDTLRVIYEQQ